MSGAAYYRLDWRSEFKTLEPFLSGRGGVVQVEYNSGDAAPDMFNHLLKEEFSARSGNGFRLSLRIDQDWYTTRQVSGILDELDRLLAGAGFPVDQTPVESQSICFVAGNEVEGDMNTTITGNTFNLGNGFHGRALATRRSSVCAAMRRYVARGGRFMITMNDAPLQDQSIFWQQLWNVGLSEAGGNNILLLIHAGPMAGRMKHQDSPVANVKIFLPDSIEGDETRQDDIYDDLVDIFEREGIPGAAGCAVTHLENNKNSVLQLHVKLSGVLMSTKQRLRGAGT